MCLTLVAPWTVACQVPLSMGFSKQEYWSELPFPSPGDLPDPGIKHRTPAMQADSLPLSHQGSKKKPYIDLHYVYLKAEGRFKVPSKNPVFVH